MIPAGSKGLGFEIGQLNIDDEAEVLIYDNLKIDLNKSAGPATCAVVTLSKDKVDELKEGLSIPYEIIGEIK